jgi:hypothetical protein
LAEFLRRRVGFEEVAAFDRTPEASVRGALRDHEHMFAKAAEGLIVASVAIKMCAREVLGLRSMVLVFGLLLLVGTGAALAKPPKGAVRGTFKTSTCVGCEGDLVARVSGRNVFCVWSKDHVMVHISFRNRAIAHLTLHVMPKYKIREGGQHGSGLGSLEDIGVDGKAFRSVWIDAGKPKGVPAKSPISSCEPYLFSLQTG